MTDAFESLWLVFPAKARQRANPVKRNGKTVPAKERAKIAFDKAVSDGVSPIHILRCARLYVESNDPQYMKAPDKWLEGNGWEAEDISNEPVKLPLRPAGEGWKTKAQGQAKTMLEAMREQGCPEDILDKLAGNVGVTNINSDRQSPPTAVYANNETADLWYRAANGYAERAGYNPVIYSKAYVEETRKKRGL